MARRFFKALGWFTISMHKVWAERSAGTLACSGSCAENTLPGGTVPDCSCKSNTTLVLKLTQVSLLWLLALCWLLSSNFRWFPFVHWHGSSTPRHPLASCRATSSEPVPVSSRFSHLFTYTFSLCSFSGSCRVCYLSPPSLVPQVPLSSVLNITITFSDTDILYQKHLGTSLFPLPVYLYSPKLRKLTNLSRRTLLKTTLSPSLPFPLYSNPCERYQYQKLLGLWQHQSLGMTANLESRKWVGTAIKVPGSAGNYHILTDLSSLQPLPCSIFLFIITEEFPYTIQFRYSTAEHMNHHKTSWLTTFSSHVV